MPTGLQRTYFKNANLSNLSGAVWLPPKRKKREWSTTEEMKGSINLTNPEIGTGQKAWTLQLMMMIMTMTMTIEVKLKAEFVQIIEYAGIIGGTTGYAECAWAHPNV
jgi:hypothetical protein